MVKIALELNRRKLQQVLKNEQENRKLKEKIRIGSANLKKDFAKKWLSG